MTWWLITIKILFAFWAAPCDTQGLFVAMHSDIETGLGDHVGCQMIEPRSVLDQPHAKQTAVLSLWPQKRLLFFFSISSLSINY